QLCEERANARALPLIELAPLYLHVNALCLPYLPVVPPDVGPRPDPEQVPRRGLAIESSTPRVERGQPLPAARSRPDTDSHLAVRRHLFHTPHVRRGRERRASRLHLVARRIHASLRIAQPHRESPRSERHAAHQRDLSLVFWFVPVRIVLWLLVAK